MNSLLRCCQNALNSCLNAIKVEDQARESPAKMQLVPLKEIFGPEPWEQATFTEHERTATGMVGPLKRRFTSSITYASPPDVDSSREAFVVYPIVEQTEVSPEQANTTPTLQFSIYHNVQMATLTINLLKATNLSLSAVNKEHQRIFLKTNLAVHRLEKHESRLVPKSRNPEFQDEFMFQNVTVERLCRESIIFRIYEGTKSSKGKFIGAVVLPLNEADLFGVVTTMKIDESGGNLPRDSIGELLLSLRYNPAKRELCGTIVEVINLHKQDLFGSADPYVKIRLMHKGTRQAKWRTSVKKNTLTPVFNETFQFDISEMDMDNIVLEIAVKDYDWFTKDDPVGQTTIGRRALSKSGQFHWSEITAYPGVNITHWHSILPAASQLS